MTSDEERDSMADDARKHGAYEAADYIVHGSIPLPMNADGLPLHVGDRVWLDGYERKVSRITYDSNRPVPWRVIAAREREAVHAMQALPSELRVRRPDSIGRIADEMEEYAETTKVGGDMAREWSYRIRKLVNERDDD